MPGSSRLRSFPGGARTNLSSLDHTVKNKRELSLEYYRKKVVLLAAQGLLSAGGIMSPGWRGPFALYTGELKHQIRLG